MTPNDLARMEARLPGNNAHTDHLPCECCKDLPGVVAYCRRLEAVVKASKRLDEAALHTESMNDMEFSSAGDALHDALITLENPHA